MTTKRKLIRAKDKQIKADIENKTMIFDLLPEHCLVCEKPFDRKDKAQVQSWYVVAKEKENIVRLYCPECWALAKAVVEKAATTKENNVEKQEE
jgi:hypothetical protein